VQQSKRPASDIWRSYASFKLTTEKCLCSPESAFTCNVCGKAGVFTAIHHSNPEMPSCTNCGSNVRFRWLVHRLATELFGRSIALTDFPRDQSIKGLGLTDPKAIATVLEERLDYRNTYFTAEPRLDIRCDPARTHELDFLIASEVFEHVEPPVRRAFVNSAVYLKESGFLLLTVPWVWDGDRQTAIPELHDWKLEREAESWTIVNRKPDGGDERFRNMQFDGGPGPSLGHTREHFPELNEWRLTEFGGEWELQNTRQDGTKESFKNLVFHEGPGLALEMRIFTRQGIEEELRAAGFQTVKFEDADTPQCGIFFGYPWSRPVVARIAKGRSKAPNPDHPLW
jgi:hypothetical protein